MTAGGSVGHEHREVKVMVIDDSRTIRRTAETLLQKEGYQVISATDGFEALSMIADNKPDLIFLDRSEEHTSGNHPGAASLHPEKSDPACC